MEFKYSCIGDNSQENREWLEKVGYKFNFVVSYVEFDIIYTWKGEMFFIDKIDVKNLEPSLFINCIGNPQLFKAVSAMREDSDYMQWFITDFSNKLIPTEPMYLCKVKCFNGVLIPYQFHEDGFHIGSGGFHKATLTELQERFKEKER